MPNTAIDEMEAVVEEVVEILSEEIEMIVDTLAPDGRPFGQELKTPDEQLSEYRVIRNDVEGWKLWVSNKALEITEQLKLGGVAEDKIQALNPLNIALAFMFDYSTRMEKLLEERML